MKQEKAIIIGGGPCGLSAAIAFKQIGIDALVIEKGMSSIVFIIIQHIKPFSVQVKSLRLVMSLLLLKIASPFVSRHFLIIEK